MNDKISERTVERFMKDIDKRVEKKLKEQLSNVVKSECGIVTSSPSNNRVQIRLVGDLNNNTFSAKYLSGLQNDLTVGSSVNLFYHHSLGNSFIYEVSDKK